MSACAPQRPPAGAEPPAASAVPGLRHAIDAVLADPALARGYWGVVVSSLKTGETLYDVNGGKLMLPASNLKIVTLAAAAEKLGWDYTYTTTLRADGTIANGVLFGSLVVSGSGDPSLAAADGAADRVFADWASRLKAAGVRSVAGAVIGIDNPMDDEALGAGWMWDDLVEDYAAGVGALQLNEDAVRVDVFPGPAPGTSAGISVAPFPGTLAVDNNVRTSASGDAPAIRMRRLPGSARLELRGSIPAGHAPMAFGVSIDNPTQFFVDALRTSLIRNGVAIDGPARVANRNAIPSGRPLVEHRSPPLSTLAIRLMKISQNQYAETFFRTIGGRQGVLDVLAPWGVAPADLIQRDGSGLSRYDLVTPRALVTVLTHVAGDPKLKDPFVASLPVAGDLGLTNRMKGTPAEGNARAKTGSMTGVRALSGYVTSGDGEPLVFSIVANNFEAAADINRAMDAIVVRLAEFRR